MTDTVGSPTARGRRLASLLKRYREAAEISVDSVASHLHTQPRSVRRWELGTAIPRLRDLEDMCALYRVAPAARDEILQVAEAARQRGWWVGYRDVLRPTYRRFIGLEAEASTLREYSGMLIPGLLQTEAYAHAVLRTSEPNLSPTVVAQLVEVRLRRQAEVESAGYPRRYILDEACLRRVQGNRNVMASQLARLAEVAEQPDVTIKLLTFDAGANALVTGGFALLTFADSEPVACMEAPGGDLYAEGAASDRYARHFERLHAGASTQPESMRIIGEIREGYEDA